MRKILLALAALAAVATTFALTSTPASASVSSYDCVTRTEQSNLRPGMTPRQVRVTTDASPWFGMPVREKGKRYYVEAYSDCNYSTGKDFAVIYNIRKDGSKHMLMSRYMRL